jgi:hypothetical protein
MVLSERLKKKRASPEGLSNDSRQTSNVSPRGNRNRRMPRFRQGRRARRRRLAQDTRTHGRPNGKLPFSWAVQCFRVLAIGLPAFRGREIWPSDPPDSPIPFEAGRVHSRGVVYRCESPVVYLFSLGSYWRVRSLRCAFHRLGRLGRTPWTCCRIRRCSP